MKWFRFYADALNDPKIQKLSGDTFKQWINLLCLASQQDQCGRLPSVDDIGFSLRLSGDAVASLVDELMARGLVDEVDGDLMIHGWHKRQFVSDNVSLRVQRHRQKQEQNPGDKAVEKSETLPKKTVKRYSNVTSNAHVTKCNALDTDTDTEESTTHAHAREDTLFQSSDDDSASHFESSAEAVQSESAPAAKPKCSAAQIEAIYQAYPRHVARGAALKAIEKAIVRLGKGRERPSGATDWPPDDFLSWLRERVSLFAASDKGNDGKYTPYPATWFNESRYLDDEREWQAKVQSNGHSDTHRPVTVTKAKEGLGFYG